MIFENIRIVFPSLIYHEGMLENSDSAQKFYNIIDWHFNCHLLESTWSQKESFKHLLAGCSGRICDDLKIFINEKLGNASITELQLQSEWSRLMEELHRIHNLAPYFADVKEICKRISKSGAPKWAERLSTEELQGAVDYLLPDDWQYAWRLRRLANYAVSRFGYHKKFKALAVKRSEIERDLSSAYKDIIARRVWLKLADNATPDVKAALQSYRAAITKIGKGTGKRAIRYRQDAKRSTLKINKAIPCWIMSHYRVSTELPAEFASFDLVVIDEASQSDLSALPAILRANKLLVVGDDQQVSPEGIGLEENKIKNLMEQHLRDQVDIYRQEMSPERSIYDLFKVVFADSQVILREHFRCVGPIIEYSKREFYNNELKPLRLPKSSERLDPPLIDIIVENGFRKNKDNPGEARFIVNEIKKICDDASMKNLSIGVVSLLGNEQARRILYMLEAEIGMDLLL